MNYKRLKVIAAAFAATVASILITSTFVEGAASPLERDIQALVSAEFIRAGVSQDALDEHRRALLDTLVQDAIRQGAALGDASLDREILLWNTRIGVRATVLCNVYPAEFPDEINDQRKSFADIYARRVAEVLPAARGTQALERMRALLERRLKPLPAMAFFSQNKTPLTAAEYQWLETAVIAKLDEAIEARIASNSKWQAADEIAQRQMFLSSDGAADSILFRPAMLVASSVEELWESARGTEATPEEEQDCELLAPEEQATYDALIKQRTELKDAQARAAE